MHTDWHTKLSADKLMLRAFLLNAFIVYLMLQMVLPTLAPAPRPPLPLNRTPTTPCFSVESAPHSQLPAEWGALWASAPQSRGAALPSAPQAASAQTD